MWKDPVETVKSNIKNYPFTVINLPRLDLELKRPKVIAEYDTIGRVAHKLLYGNYQTQSVYNLSLSPEKNTDVTARFSVVEGNLIGRGLVDYLGKVASVHCKVSTEKSKPFVKTMVRYYDPQLLRGARIAFSVLGNKPTMNDLVGEFRLGYQLPDLSVEAAINSNRVVSGWSVFQYQKVVLAAKGAYDALAAVPKHLELAASYRSKGVSPKSFGVTKEPNFFDFTVKFSPLDNSLVASYVQLMKMESFMTGYHHNVVLGGEYRQTTRVNDAIDNVLTVGGSWQLSMSLMVKARVDTQGNVGAVVGGRLAGYPSAVLSLCTTQNVLAQGAKPAFGVTFSLEG